MNISELLVLNAGALNAIFPLIRRASSLHLLSLDKLVSNRDHRSHLQRSARLCCAEGISTEFPPTKAPAKERQHRTNGTDFSLWELLLGFLGALQPGLALSQQRAESLT